MPSVSSLKPAEIVSLARAGSLAELRKSVNFSSEACAEDGSGWNLLHAACSYGREDVVEWCLANFKVVPNATTQEGRTPLHLASLSGSKKCVRMILEAGADKELKTPEGKTARDIALLFEHNDVAEEIDSFNGSTVDNTSRSAAGKELVTPPITAKKKKKDLGFEKWAAVNDEAILAMEKESLRQTSLQPASSRSANKQVPEAKEQKSEKAENDPYKISEGDEELVKSMDRDRLLTFKPPREGGEPPDENNGFTSVKYQWGQDPSEIWVRKSLPENTTAKQLKVDFGASTLSVSIKHPKEAQIIRKGKLWGAIKPEESIWHIEDGMLIITLSKAQNGFWRCVMHGDTKIDSTRCKGPDLLTDLPQDLQEETRSMFRKMLSS